MHVSKIMTADPTCCTPHTSLQEAANLFVQCDCGMLPVVDSHETRRVIGAITDRDIVCRIIAEGQNPLECKVADCMSTPAFVIAPHDTIEFATELMEEHQIRRLIVIDEDGCAIGLVSQADIALYNRTLTGELLEQVSQPTHQSSNL